MNIYLLTQEENIGYDTFSSMCIIAANEEDAIGLSLIRSHYYQDFTRTNDLPIFRNFYKRNKNDTNNSWSFTPTIKLLGINDDLNEGIICASFHAG